MPAHVELHLLSKLIDTGEMKTVLEEGISIDTFGNPDARETFNGILTYYQDRETRNIVPDWDWIDKYYGSVDLPEPSDRYTTRALCIEVKKNWLKKRLEKLLVDVSDSYEVEPFETLKEMTQELKELEITTHKSKDVILGDSMDDLKREYQMAKENTGYIGIPYPMGWGYHTESGKPKMLKKTGRQDHPLNEQTRGKQNGEFILLYGRPKSMKTWLLIDMAVEDYSYNHCRTLIFTKEMSPEQLRARFVARMLCVDYMDFKNGDLSPDKEEEFYDLVDHLKEDEQRFKEMGKKSSLLITTGWTGQSNISGLASLEAKIDEFEPDVVYADAVYLMEVVRKGQRQVWQDMSEISYGLKGIARDRGIPVVATSQANRKGEETKGSTLAEIAYGDSFGQACDVAIRVIKRELDDGSVNLACIISGGREIKLPGFLLRAEPAIRFELEQIFESNRQIQAQFRAEEEAFAQEERRAMDKLRKDGRVGQHKSKWS